MYKYMHIYSFSGSFPFTGYYKILTIVPCAIQWVIAFYFIYSGVYNDVEFFFCFGCTSGIWRFPGQG